MLVSALHKHNPPPSYTHTHPMYSYTSVKATLTPGGYEAERALLLTTTTDPPGLTHQHTLLSSSTCYIHREIRFLMVTCSAAGFWELPLSRPWLHLAKKTSPFYRTHRRGAEWPPRTQLPPLAQHPLPHLSCIRVALSSLGSPRCWC